jgi:hypothetical protein
MPFSQGWRVVFFKKFSWLLNGSVSNSSGTRITLKTLHEIPAHERQIMSVTRKYMCVPNFLNAATFTILSVTWCRNDEPWILFITVPLIILSFLVALVYLVPQDIKEGVPVHHATAKASRKPKLPKR